MRILWVFVAILSLVSIHAEIQTLKTPPRIFLIPDFLSHEECDYIIRLAQPHLQRSTVVDDINPKNDGVIDPRRSSQGMFLPQNPSDSVLRSIEQRIATLTGLPIENGEALHVLRYQVGGQYEPHYDYFNPATPGGAAHLARGGQRLASCIMYLHEPTEGGETIFPNVNVSITPKRGTALLFYNCTPEGEVDPQTLHGGAIVKGGEKWIATKWIRMGVFH